MSGMPDKLSPLLTSIGFVALLCNGHRTLLDSLDNGISGAMHFGCELFVQYSLPSGDIVAVVVGRVSRNFRHSY